MYYAYRAYTGQYPHGRTDLATVLDGINEADEEIISVTPVGEDNLNVVIITRRRV